MPRKGLVFRRTQATDPVYASDIVEKFICSMMWEGKKSTAQRVFYGAMDQVAKKTNDDALKIFKKAIENVKPLLEVKTRRVGGANYQVPVEVNPFRRQSLAIRWLKARPPWTGWSRSASAALLSPARRRRLPGIALARNIASILLIRRATWTLPWKSSARCACLTARFACSIPLPACSRSPRRYGARRTSTASRASVL